MADYKEYEPLPPSEPTLVDEEQQNLLPTSTSSRSAARSKSNDNHTSPAFLTRLSNFKPVTVLIIGYLAGIITILLPALLLRLCLQPLCGTNVSDPQQPLQYAYQTPHLNSAALPSFPGDIGSTQIHDYPPSSATNAIPSLFPTKVGFAGPTATGAEPGLVLTAGQGMYPPWRGIEGLVHPELPPTLAEDPTPVWIEDTNERPKGRKGHKEKFSIFRHWGNLTPFHSVPSDSFGIHSSTGPEVPSGCTLKGVHILHRHGARYPTEWSGYAAPGSLASKLHKAARRGEVKGTGKLEFLNSWTYKLGTDSLTPFGRQQLFDLGVSMRVKYGSLLEGFTDRLPVFRTESQDRMLASATNFALGFFGWPLEEKFLLSVTVEEKCVNNTLAPYKTCPNDSNPQIGDRGTYYVKQWVGVYLLQAQRRIQPLLEGYELSLEDVYTMQMMCAYETVSLGYSSFCALFTEQEWEGFEYALDLYFWYDSGFGSPVARALGSGYVLELLSRLTATPLTSPNPLTNNPSTFSVNLTLDANPTTFPLDQPIYVDATHEVVIVNIVTALNLTVLAEDGPPSPRRMKRGRRWVSSRIAPFASNMQLQLLECPNLTTQSPSSSNPTQVRIILNDGVVSLTGVSGCPSQKDGLCPVDTFVKAQKKLIEGSDWDWTCHGNWTVPEGDAWMTQTGDPPKKPRGSAGFWSGGCGA